MNARKKRFGDYSEYYGNRPIKFDSIRNIKDPVEQVVAQVHEIEREITKNLEQFPAGNVFRIKYHELVASPYSVLDKFIAFMASHDMELSIDENPPQLQFENRNNPSLIATEIKEPLLQSFGKKFGQEKTLRL